VSKVNLNTLDLASNQISRIQNISHLSKLEDFWVCTASRLRMGNALSCNCLSTDDDINNTLVSVQQQSAGIME
jgi:Leucine-rich repeat (LRR) protein